MFTDNADASVNHTVSLLIPDYAATGSHRYLQASLGGGGMNVLYGGGSVNYYPAYQHIWYTGASNAYTGTARFGVKNDGQLYLVPVSAPTVDVQNGDVYFDSANGLTQRKAGTWEILIPEAPAAGPWVRSNFTWVAVGGPYLPISGGTISGTLLIDTNTVLHTGIIPVPPTNNGAYVLFVTNGVASWIAHP